MALRTITLRGFKSIANLENFEMRNINLLIGANGSGKSNFLSAFKFLAKIAQENLQGFIISEGGPDAFLHGGRKRTQFIEIEVFFDETRSIKKTNFGKVFNSDRDYGYSVLLNPTADNKIIIVREGISVKFGRKFGLPFNSNSEESKLDKAWQPDSEFIRKSMRSFRQYHFHDTGQNSPIKGICDVNDNIRLKEDGQNISAYLSMLRHKHPWTYQNILQTVRMAAPFLGGFIDREGQEKVQIEWFERGDPDTVYKSYALSDGTLRFICLVTLLLQPLELLPETILIDEPELGLHPYAISLLAEMIKQVAETKQVVIATQSVELLNHFQPEDVVVADREGAATVLRRLDEDDLGDWLKSYSLGELWQKNVFGGRPV